jgi:two-component system chemotaxis response regulator CheB
MIRVFVVDDSAFARRAITRVLRAEPAITVVGEASSGTEALLRVPSAQPDLVTLDLDMPGMNGLTVLRTMLGRDPGLRVLMLSAHTRDGAEATVEALAAGAVDFLDKSRFGLMEFEGLGRELVGPG